MYSVKRVMASLLNELTPDDVRSLIAGVDEFERRGAFERAFPPEPAGSPQSATSAANDLAYYMALFEQPRYYNLLAAAFLSRYNTRAKYQQGMPVAPRRALRMLTLLKVTYLHYCRRVHYLLLYCDLVCCSVS